MVVDQAHRLRALVRRGATEVSPRGAMPVVAVSGGHGGVGASTIALHLATALNRGGWRPLLIEADLDRGGRIEQANRGDSIADCLAGARSLAEVCRPGPEGILVVPGAWVPCEVADCTALAQQRLLAELQQPTPPAAVAVIDLGSSRNAFVRRFWQMASMVIVVATVKPESVMDAYATIKVLHAGDTSIPVYTLLNFARRPHDTSTIHERIGQTCRRFLGLRTSALASLPRFDSLASRRAIAAADELAATLAVELGLTSPHSRAVAA